MKSKDLKQERMKNAPELANELVKSQARLEELRFDLVQGKVKNIREIRSLRRTIAQLRSLMNEAEKRETKLQSASGGRD